MINLKAGKVVVATVSHGNIIPLLLVVSALLLLTSSSVSRAQSKYKSVCVCNQEQSRTAAALMTMTFEPLFIFELLLTLIQSSLH